MHEGYCLYSWDDESLLDYSAHRNYNVEQAPFFTGYDTVAPAVTASATSWVVQQDSGVGSTPPVETVLSCRDRNGPRAVALPAGCPPLFWVLHIAAAAMVSSHAPSSGQSTSFTVPVPTRLSTSQSHSTPGRAGVYDGEEIEPIIHPMLSEVILSVKCSLRCVWSGLAHCSRRGMLNPSRARAAWHVLLSAAARTRLFSTSSACRLGDLARFLARSVSYREATQSQSPKQESYWNK